MNRLMLFALWLLGTCILGNQVLAAPAKGPMLDIKVPPPEVSAGAHVVYFEQLLQLALHKTEEDFGPFVIHRAKQAYTSKRLLSELKRTDGAVDVIWTSNSNQRERELLPIKISILRGLNSYRVFLIRADQQSLFDRVNSLAQLRELQAGQGAQWPDTQVLEQNQLPVMAVANSNLLFEMLANKRFDYFPRGLYEVWNEQAKFARLGLVVERHLLLHYPAPIYFFVSKQNKPLAARIKLGLERAQADGSFEQLFFSVEGFKRGYEELQQGDRLKFDLISDFQDMD